MSAVAWTHWDEAFLAADKEPEKRVTFTLSPPLFERALVSLASEHGWLPKSDPRYQEACKDGFLEWWDGRGRCVVIVREGSNAWNQMLAPSHARNPKFAELPDREMPAPKMGDSNRPPPDVDAFNVAAEKALKEAEDKAIVAEFVGSPAAPPGDPSLPPETGKATFAKALEVLAPKGKGKKK